MRYFFDRRKRGTSMRIEELLREKAGDEEFEQGKALFHRALVRETRRSREECAYIVSGAETHLVRVTAGGAHCDCGGRLCRHGVAAVLAARDSGALAEMERFRAQQAVPALFEAVSGMLPESDGILLAPVLFLTREGLRIGLKIGEERLYVVRHIPHFLQCREDGTNLPFGKGFEYRPQWMRFDENQNKLLDILAEFCEAPAVRALTGADARVMLLTPRVAARVLDALRSLPFTLQINGEQYSLNGVASRPLALNFHLAGAPQKLSITAELPERLFPLTKNYRFILADGECIFTPPEQRTLLSTLQRYAMGRDATFSFSPQDTPRVMSDLLPFLLRVGTVTIDPALENAFLHLPLAAKVYLDKEGPEVTAQVSFQYGQIEIDPFVPESVPKDALLLRDAAAERAVLDELAQAGFHVRRGKVYLTGSERIFDFVMSGAARLTPLAEVFFSKDFRRMTPRKPLFHGMMQLKNGRLLLEMSDGDTPIEELLPLMEALRRRRRYFRFKDGTFLDLSDMESWQPLAEAVAESQEATGRSDLAACWAAYLGALIRENHLDVVLDEGAKQASSLSFTAPPPPVSCLRPYQQRGYEWLLSLHALGMGGILADDMGLGKTVQTLSALLSCVQHEKERMPSLIVAPTSLTYNWLNECRHFTPQLSGYLPRYTDFLRRWGEGQNAEDLRRRIRPFLMRRLKGDVLGELPEKLESVLMAELPPEQRRVYDAALLQKRERVDEILRSKGLNRGRAEVLSAITELRQICCHPALCLPDYQGLSGKLELLMDVLPPALAAGRRALIFSQFTSMLHLIEKRLTAEGVSYLYLDGETPASQRVSLTQRFNDGEANVFLISLKAGGTGLNLTGADLVIHYDPWWNPTAEEQATGRAHRIGQTKKVEVLRLVVHNSIEEQVLRMSDRKRRLFDKLITPGEEMPTKLSEQDILALFDADEKG